MQTNGHITVNPPSIQNVALLDGRAVLLIRNPFEAAVSAFTHWEGNLGHSLSIAPFTTSVWLSFCSNSK